MEQLHGIESPALEQFDSTSETNPAEERLEDAADSYGFKNLPKAGTIARKRLIEACEEYAKRVHYQQTSPFMSIDDRRSQKSDQERRRWHEGLCIMLLGTQHSATSSEDRRRVSNFAVMTAGMDQYIGTF